MPQSEFKASLSNGVRTWLKIKSKKRAGYSSVQKHLFGMWGARSSMPSTTNEEIASRQHKRCVASPHTSCGDTCGRDQGLSAESEPNQRRGKVWSWQEDPLLEKLWEDDYSVGQSSSEYTRTQAEDTESLRGNLTDQIKNTMHIKINYTNGLKICESK